MAIRPNRYNDPALGAAFENIASLFAPMSGSDVAGYAAADVNRQKAMAEAQRVGLIDMFVQGGNDRAGIGAELFTPAQSYYAVDQGNATTRRGQNLSYQLGTENNQRDNATTARGQDLTFRSSTENNIRDNGARIYGTDQALRGDVLDTLMKPVGEGEVRPALSPEMAQWIGIPTGLDPVEGRQKPMTEDQVAGAALQAARDQGLYTAQNAADARIYDGTPVQVTGPNGAPVYADPTTAMRDGLPAYVKPDAGTAPKLTNVRLPDGRQTTALQTPDGLIDPATRQPLPAGTTMFSTAAQGSAEDVGLGKTTQGKIQQQQVDIGQALGTARSLRQLIADNGASQGLVGYARGTAQNLIQSGSELGQYLGGQAAEAAKAVQEGAMDAGLYQEMFDPSLPAIDMLGNMLAFQYAKSLTGERLSNEMLRSARKALGFDRPLSNQADSLARLDMAIQQMENQRAYLGDTLATGAPGDMAQVSVEGAPPPATPAHPAVSQPAASGRIRYDAQGNRIQ